MGGGEEKEERCGEPPSNRLLSRAGNEASPASCRPPPLTLTMLRCAIAGRPPTSGRNAANSPNSPRVHGVAPTLQPLKSPTRHAEDAPGAHSRYQMPAAPVTGWGEGRRRVQDAVLSARTPPLPHVGAAVEAKVEPPARESVEAAVERLDAAERLLEERVAPAQVAAVVLEVRVLQAREGGRGARGGRESGRPRRRPARMCRRLARAPTWSIVLVPSSPTNRRSLSCRGAAAGANVAWRFGPRCQRHSDDPEMRTATLYSKRSGFAGSARQGGGGRRR